MAYLGANWALIVRLGFHPGKDLGSRAVKNGRRFVTGTSPFVLVARRVSGGASRALPGRLPKMAALHAKHIQPITGIWMCLFSRGRAMPRP